MRTQQTYHQRVVYGSDLLLEFVPRTAKGEPRTPSAPPTVAVTRLSDGATVTAGTVTAPDTPDQAYTALIAAATNTDVDEYTATWTVDGVDHTRRVQLVGGAYIDVDQVEEDGHDVYPEAAADDRRRHRAREIAELEAERLTGQAWVRQIRQHQAMVGFVDSTLLVPDARPRVPLRAVTQHDSLGAVSYTWTAAERAAVFGHDWGGLERLSGCWPRGLVTVTYDHGWDLPPADLAEAVARRYAWWLARPESAVPDTAVTWSAAEGGGTFRLGGPTPGRTGDRDVDAIYRDYASHIGRVGFA